VPDSSQITTMDAPISISESRAKPASATDRAAMAAKASTAIPATFHASVAYSSRTRGAAGSPVSGHRPLSQQKSASGHGRGRARNLLPTHEQLYEGTPITEGEAGWMRTFSLVGWACSPRR
jgi:uncharacterized protein YfaQ (DUF2300 family)